MWRPEVGTGHLSRLYSILVTETGSPENPELVSTLPGNPISALQGLEPQATVLTWLKVLEIQTRVRKCACRGLYLLSEPSGQPRSGVLELAHGGSSILLP